MKTFIIGKCKFIFVAFLSFFSITTAFAYDFSAVCASGQTLYYNITSEKTPYTVEIIPQNVEDPYYENYPSGILNIPENVTYSGKNYSVTSLGDWAFSSCVGLTSISIPKSVISIGSFAFADCVSLTSVSISDYVENIGMGVFLGCTGLKKPVYNANNFIYFPDGFATDYSIPFGVKHICGDAFFACRGIKSVIIPNSVTSIGESAFSGCEGLTKLEISNSVVEIGSLAFGGCSGLTAVIIPNSVRSLGDEAFNSCSGLTSITIPDSVTQIGNSVFSFCSALTTVNYNAINGTYKMRYGEDYSTFFLFEVCYKIETLNIGDNVKKIPDFAFWGCSGVKSVRIPESVTEIGKGAFEGCSGLTSIVIPSSVRTIGEGAFEGCTAKITYQEK